MMWSMWRYEMISLWTVKYSIIMWLILALLSILATPICPYASSFCYFNPLCTCKAQAGLGSQIGNFSSEAVTPVSAIQSLLQAPVDIRDVNCLGVPFAQIPGTATNLMHASQEHASIYAKEISAVFRSVRMLWSCLQILFASIIVDCEQKYEWSNFVLDIPAPYLTHIDLVDADLEVIQWNFQGSHPKYFQYSGAW